VLQNANSMEAHQLSVNAQGFVVKGYLIVVPDYSDLMTLIIRETHDSPYAGHYGIIKTICAVGHLFWWPSLKVDVTNFISVCPPCQRNKSRRHRPYGLLKPLKMPEGPFDSISYDSITKLPLTPYMSFHMYGVRGNFVIDSICVFVDNFSKMAFFVPCHETITAKGFAKPYVDHMQATQGLSKTFISDSDTRFTSAFLQEVTALLDTRLCMSSAFYAPFDEQTENVTTRFSKPIRVILLHQQ
jgi:hypothetical protein